MSGSPSGTALTLHLRSSSFSPTLASPGDSGVALDSDMDLSNETDGSSCREVIVKFINFIIYHKLFIKSGQQILKTGKTMSI